MDIQLDLSTIKSNSEIRITGSKSESNRLLILKALYPEIQITNLSNSDDTSTMTEALSGNSVLINVHHAGTAMRFLTAYFAQKSNSEVTITGSERMKQRPIGVLVDALRAIGADITYMGESGYPPMKIVGKKMNRNEVSINADVSSQYITALLLIAPRLENGLKIELLGKITSRPYIEMTLSQMAELGVYHSFVNNNIHIYPMRKLEDPMQITVESDWSSASYFFSFVALSPVGTALTLRTFKPDSIQGDSELVDLYRNLGVQVVFNDGSVDIEKTESPEIESLELDLSKTPDLAQTLAVSCCGLKIPCHFTGLHTLKIKETDRLVALKNELTKCGADVEITEHSLSIISFGSPYACPEIETYQDHRMALAFAPLCLKHPLQIRNAEVVSKSYPEYWDHLKDCGVRLNIL